MLTDEELNKVFSWQPYRDEWKVDRNMKEDNILLVYGNLINSMTKNPLFDTYYSQDGSLGNYLEFICYPKGGITYHGNAIIVCVSLCAPISAYGQTTLNTQIDSISVGGLFNPDKTGEIADITLIDIETEIKKIIDKQNISLLNREFVGRQLPVEVWKELQYENHNYGSQYLHGIFQKTD